MHPYLSLLYSVQKRLDICFPAQENKKQNPPSGPQRASAGTLFVFLPERKKIISIQQRADSYIFFSRAYIAPRGPAGAI